MQKLPIEHRDSGATAREKINNSRKQLLDDVEKKSPKIIGGEWRVGDVNTGVKAEGRCLKLRKGERTIQYQIEGSEIWNDLITLEELRGEGGDMLKAENLSGIADYQEARENLGVFSKEEVNEAIAGKEDKLTLSTAGYYLRGDKKWADFAHAVRSAVLTGLNTTQNVLVTAKDSVLGALGKLQGQISAIITALNDKADLIDGKIPSSQLPEVQAIDESNLVHKNGDETITGKKVFSGGIALSDGKIYLRNHGDNNHYIVFDGSAGNGGDGMRIHEVGGLTFSTVSGDAVKIKQDRSLELYSNMIIPQNASIFVGGNDILGEWQSWTPTNGSATITDHHCRYKIIGKTCHFIAQVYVNNVAGNTPGFTLPIPRANYVTEFMVAGYCVRRGENPATQSRGAISFSGREGVFTLGSTDVGTFTQPGEYIIRASGSYETA